MPTRAWGHGGATYPLTASTSNALLKDADPAVYYLREYIAALLEAYVKPRLMAQAALEGLVIANAVATALSIEITPAVLAGNFRFPIFALARKGEAHEASSNAYTRSTTELEFSYVLPPLTPRQVDKLTPILRSVTRVIGHGVGRGYDRAYADGASVWVLAGISRARLASASYGNFEEVENQNGTYRAVTGKIEVLERDVFVPGAYEAMDGADVTLDLTTGDGTTYADVTSTSTHPAPTVTAITPTSGPKTGGTTVTVTGTGFRQNTPTSLRIGEAECDDVVVLSATQVRGVTGDHAAYPTSIEDVVVTNFDGQSGTLAAGFTYTTP